MSKILMNTQVFIVKSGPSGLATLFHESCYTVAHVPTEGLSIALGSCSGLEKD